MRPAGRVRRIRRVDNPGGTATYPGLSENSTQQAA